MSKGRRYFPDYGHYIRLHFASRNALAMLVTLKKRSVMLDRSLETYGNGQYGMSHVSWNCRLCLGTEAGL